MPSVWSDLRRSVRSLRTTPGQSAAALLALSLGIATAVTLYTAFRVVADDLPPTCSRRSASSPARSSP